jgi:hypothetical protein
MYFIGQLPKGPADSTCNIAKQHNRKIMGWEATRDKPLAAPAVLVYLCRHVANGHDPGHESRPPGQQARPDAPNEAKLAGTLHKHIAKPAYGQEGEDGEQ